MLRSSSRRALVLRRALSTNSGAKPPSSASTPVPPAPQDAVAAAAKKSSIGSTIGSSSSSSASSASTSAPSSSSSGGSLLPKLLLLGVLTAPAGVAVYVNQNPSWNPEILRGNENWIKFRELALGNNKEKAAPPASKPKPAAVKAPVPPAKMPDELSQVITKDQKTPAAAASTSTTAKKQAEATATESKKKANNTSSTVAEQVEKKADEVIKAVIAAEHEAEKRGSEMVKAVIAAEQEVVKAVVAAEQEVVKKSGEVVKAVIAAEQDAVKKVTAAAAAAVTDAKLAVTDAKLAVEKKVDEATQKAREEIDKLAAEASPANLSNKVEKKIQATTKEILDTLRADSDAAADDVDKNYLNGIHELDANALVIRVAQLATEMKHRSKWEAARLLEALRVMEENAQKKSAEVLRLQDELHKELVAKELRLQQEVLTRKTREEIENLKKSYAEDLARNVNAERAAILNKLQETFTREKKIIEERYAQQLRSKSKELQEVLAKERKQRVSEMENYRAQLRALNTVLENSSTYEAFSHQIHKTSVAALALSDRIEAAAPLRAEIRALREAARSDEFIEVALKSLPQSVIDEGAPSVSQLQERFNVVKKIAHRAALAPENSGLAGQLFGSALSFLIIPPGGPIEGNDTDAVFSRADYALKAGDIESAVSEMKALSGVPAAVSKDWISAAESRLAVEQTAKVVKAHVALLAASCS